MQISQDGLNLIKSFEGFRSEPYPDVGGIWTIGYGTTILTDGKRVTPDTPPVTEAEATEMLEYTCARLRFHKGDWYLQTSPIAFLNKLNQNQQDAVFSLVYNIGLDNFEHSTVLKCIMSKTPVDTAWRMWNKVGHTVCPGLTSRRTKELELFNKPV